MFKEIPTTDEKALLVTYFGEKLSLSTDLEYYYITLENKDTIIATLMSGPISNKIKGVNMSSTICNAIPAPSPAHVPSPSVVSSYEEHTIQ